ncbi:ROK family protein [Desulforhabdus amnigena]|jgi:glucokinase|uniref:Glucokinase n=1 Tax=Desulforhabdus amnigena TaxID=40218 RepID=A0A9W6L7S5_9BACT|nr:ROK family protein [Desulforhabdus amnigena]NLJ27438.1 ROK family protein [Deltaproteobacteria bacterium]GLI34963.1 glucokinase [Desulforhabdus amnigena]
MKKRMFIGIDIGGTNMRAALIDKQGKILQLNKIPTDNAAGAENASKRLVETCRSLVQKSPEWGGNVVGIGMGVAGKINAKEGLVVFSPNIPCMRNYPLGIELEEGLSIPVVMENDANVFGIGENWIGAGHALDNWVGLTLGTGVGGCLILEGRLWEGDHLGFAAELGHIIVQPGGPLCNCGLRGCLEAHASGRALMQGVEEAVEQGALSNGPLFEKWQRNALNPKVIYECALQEDPTALKLFNRMGWALGLAIANLFTALGIRHAIIGGGVSASWDLFVGPLRESLANHSSFLSPEEMVILRSSLQDDAALVGAAKLAMDLTV